MLNRIWHNIAAMAEILFERTGRLFANPSMEEGITRSVDLFGNYVIYNINNTPLEADCQALYSDWAAVGDHLILAAKEVSKK